MTAQDSLVAGVLATIRSHGLLLGGETVLVAVSGGADSVALVHILAALRPRLGLTLHAIHVDHGLRPEAGADADFVSALCRRWKVPLHVERVVVEGSEGLPGAGEGGLEAAARRARYAAFLARATGCGASRIATGHTADDQAETVCMRLLEGAGPRGLAGIPISRGPYIRPLLETTRGDIARHLRDRGLPWVEDPSNRDRRFLRNRIRHDVLPFLAATWDPAVVGALCRGAAVARAAVSRLDAVAAQELARLAEPCPGGLRLPIAALDALPPEVAAEVVRGGLSRLGATAPLRAHAHRAIGRMLAIEPPRRAFRVGPVRLDRSGQWLRLATAVATPGLLSRCWRPPGTLMLPEVGLALEGRWLTRSDAWALPGDARRAVFDADGLAAELTVRARRPGDRFAPFGGPGRRRLKAVLAEAGIPRWDRDRIPLLEMGGEIVWVAGVSRGRAAPVTSRTDRILEVTLTAPLAAHGTPE